MKDELQEETRQWCGTPALLKRSHRISKKRMAAIAAIPDTDIDTTDIPEVGEDFFKRATLTTPPK